MIRFVLDGDIVTLNDVDPSRTVLDWLREDRKRTGTKEGCNEGDCGACTCAIGELKEGAVQYRAVNTCIQFLPMLHGKELVTVESLGSSRDLHPVQSGLSEGHGTQCGFCTPGIVMSLFARYQTADGDELSKVDDVLAGNLCRCTGYGPIINAANATVKDVEVQSRFGQADTVSKLTDISGDPVPSGRFEDRIHGRTAVWFMPKTETDLVSILKDHPDATLIAGATDVGLWVTKQNRFLEAIVFLDQIESLKQIDNEKDGVRIGAKVSYSDAHSALADIHPDLNELVRRIGSVQVRNSGTIGANIANGSPIGDTMPALIALGAELEVLGPDGSRIMPLESFFIAYGKQDLRQGEFVRSVFVPRLNGNQHFAAYKISKRFDQDISALLGCFTVTVENDVVADMRIAFGGMAATPKRAEQTEKALLGKSWPVSDAVLDEAIGKLDLDYQPISDMRASAEYRTRVAKNLLKKFALETRAPAELAARTRLIGA